MYCGGIWQMKTKIIYISGSEVFEMADVRAAFEEVRNALGLGKDTVLFGVPVDSDNALADTEKQEINNIVQTDTCITIDSNETLSAETPSGQNTYEQSPQTEVLTESVKTAEQPVIENFEPEITEPAQESPENTPENFEDNEEEEKVIPILSVLGANEEKKQDAPMIDDDETHLETEILETKIDVDIVSVVPNHETNQIDIQKINISETINEEIPTAPEKQTLEQLLESMTPLREDIEDANESYSQDNVTDEADNTESEIPENNFTDDDDTDATLAQLASEFAETEDKIITEKKPEPQGKIGKLKNILPFKKIKREDNSLMGDLFGWAGIAANDEDFSIPGFFTPTASKKQGA